MAAGLIHVKRWSAVNGNTFHMSTPRVQDANTPAASGGPENAARGTLGVRALACRRGRRLLFQGLNLSLSPGAVVWLRGSNGSGKTSLLRILAGLSAPAAGELTWNGQPWPRRADLPRPLYIGHANALKDDLTLAEAVAFLARLQGLDDAPARANRAIACLGLASRRQALVRTLSQGQRRRGALARLALDDAPATWLLDEPFDALDQASVALLSELITSQAQRGGSVLLTSHQPPALPTLQEFDLEPWRAS
jgi:heme exporter protein A